MKFPSYKKEKPEGAFDAIVIGSGIGGQATASLLAREGQKVLVLERHYTAGGFTHMFKRKDYEWDVGIHYIGEVHYPKSALAQIFEYLSDGKLQWADMGEVYDKIIFGDEVYEFRAGVENFKNQLKTYFPDRKDQQSIDDYVELVFKTTRSVQPFFAERALPKVASMIMGPFMRSSLLKVGKLTTKQVLSQLTDNPKLIGVLCGQYGDYGLPPSQSSFAIHAMVAKHYFRGGSYPVGGSSRLVNTIAPAIIKAGGNIFTNADVKQILVRDGKAVGVRMQDDFEIMAPLIISNAGIDITYGELLDEKVRDKAGLKSQLQALEPSASHISLYLGLQHTAEELNLSKANLWIYPDSYDHDENLKRYQADENAPLPVAYVSFPGAKDPDFTNRFPGRTTIEVIGFAPYERFEKWEDERWKHRGEEYEAYKDQISGRLLEQLLRFEPQLAGKIDYQELSTPLTTRHFVNYKRGEIYGIAHTPDRFTKKFLRPQTPVKNLYLTGQDVVTAGIGGALFAGILTASAILGKDIFRDILKHTNAKVHA